MGRMQAALTATELTTRSTSLARAAAAPAGAGRRCRVTCLGGAEQSSPPRDTHQCSAHAGASAASPPLLEHAQT